MITRQFCIDQKQLIEATLVWAGYKKIEKLTRNNENEQILFYRERSDYGTNRYVEVILLDTNLKYYCFYP
jgi:hypothetical protein